MSNFVFLGILLWVFATPNLGKNNAVYLKTRVFLEKDTVLLSDIARLGKDVGDRIIVQKLDSPTQISANSLEQELNQDDSGISVYGKECLVVPMNDVYQKDESSFIQSIGNLSSIDHHQLCDFRTGIVSNE